MTKLFFAAYSAALFGGSALFAFGSANAEGSVVNPMAMQIAVVLALAGFAMSVATIVLASSERAR